MAMIGLFHGCVTTGSGEYWPTVAQIDLVAAHPMLDCGKPRLPSVKKKAK
jgi:hypothetical protein